MRDRADTSVVLTVKESMLKPRPANRPLTLDRTPASLSTRTDNVYLFSRSDPTAGVLYKMLLTFSVVSASVSACVREEEQPQEESSESGRSRWPHGYDRQFDKATVRATEAWRQLAARSRAPSMHCD